MTFHIPGIVMHGIGKYKCGLHALIDNMKILESTASLHVNTGIQCVTT